VVYIYIYTYVRPSFFLRSHLPHFHTSRDIPCTVVRTRPCAVAKRARRSTDIDESLLGACYWSYIYIYIPVRGTRTYNRIRRLLFSTVKKEIDGRNGVSVSVGKPVRAAINAPGERVS